VSVSIDIIMLVLIIANLLLLGFSQLRPCIVAVACQGLALGALPLLAHQGGVTVWAILMSVVTVGLKGIAFPKLLLSALREAEVRHEVEPYVGYTTSTLVGFVSLAVSAWLCSRLPSFGGAPSTLAAPVSFFMVFVGLFVIVSRKKAISQIIGYLVLENGIYVFGVVMLREMPLLVELGVLLDAFAAVFVMGVAVYHINRELEHIDVDQLDMLRG
jgi:hydrogenase-4 component E